MGDFLGLGLIAAMLYCVAEMAGSIAQSAASLASAKAAERTAKAMADMQERHAGRKGDNGNNNP